MTQEKWSEFCSRQGLASTVAFLGFCGVPSRVFCGQRGDGDRVRGGLDLHMQESQSSVLFLFSHTMLACFDLTLNNDLFHFVGTFRENNNERY